MTSASGHFWPPAPSTRILKRGSLMGPGGDTLFKAQLQVLMNAAREEAINGQHQSFVALDCERQGCL
jgi:hypothetical protein